MSDASRRGCYFTGFLIDWVCGVTALLAGIWMGYSK